jgi:hypothetical protein
MWISGRDVERMPAPSTIKTDPVSPAHKRHLSHRQGFADGSGEFNSCCLQRSSSNVFGSRWIYSRRAKAKFDHCQCRDLSRRTPAKRGVQW